MDVFKRAMSKGIVAIARGTTTGMIVEEILGDFERANYVAGCIRPQRLCLSLTRDTLPEVAFVDGAMKEIPTSKIVREMKKGDVFIKSANALDPEFRAGVFLGNLVGGTMGTTLGTIYAKGIELLIPVGLEKMIPTRIDEASKRAGILKVSYSTGMPVGLFPVRGVVVTEIQALESFGNVEVTPIGAGGVRGAEGSVVFSISGEKKEVLKVIERVKGVLGEKPLKVPKRLCRECNWPTCPWTGKEKSF
ncbi:MAG: hypothetical protein ACE5K0_08615 [Candidatus Methanofastidiosia archaeon]